LSRITLIAPLVTLALSAPAMAADYPAPTDPGKVQTKPAGPHRTLKVCAKGKKTHKGCFKTIQKAINAAKPGDTVKVPDGVWKEGVKIQGAKKRYLNLIGNIQHPGKVVLEGKNLKGAAKSNGVLINGANEVTVRGITAQHYNGNGFFVTNATGYHFNDLIARYVGVYGLYAFNTIGGEMRRDIGAWNNDSGFYVGQTPKQTKPIRTVISDVISYGNVLGYSGTNSRYVTITKSKWFNNGVGIVPNALDSEKFPPPEENVITDNDIFWNNFDYYKGAPFKLRPPATGDVPYPTGVGVLLFGGRNNVISNNRIYGNWLLGAGMIEQFLLKNPADGTLVGNQITDNQFGLNGTDLNGRDIGYDGNGSGNCVSGNTGVDTVMPADGHTLAPCPFGGANEFNEDARNTAVGWAVASDQSVNYIRHDHAAQAAIKPLEAFGAIKPLEVFSKDAWGQ
jgi:Right handed beta helix region